MWIKYHEEPFTPYNYIECDEINMNWGKIQLFKDKKTIKIIDLDKINFFYISENDPRI